MGLIERMMGLVFGSGRNVVAETAEVFRVNAEAQAGREAGLQSAALQQFGQEFRLSQRGWFDRLMDALNRIPRPAMALGTLALFIAAMVDPVWFAARMTGIALVPDPLWWLLGAIVSFYFGARYQAKGQDFRRDLAATISTVPQVVRTIGDIDALRDVTPRNDASGTLQGEEAEHVDNPALAEWRQARS
ncbi:holin family protein [Puniceibacterium sediminis]|uniref:Holin of 3TMs, for gene-transfer release n=1 Tax=Puniceibacterium sediminis TaxID=1608407 RepID=A0A238W3T1_9RHOB|nr:holin family protein [Puniceibacterium sediminis]SNR41061.1 Holin of 3TMs, for gene-transfer release [Puniceibacterium sediminis]